MDGNAVGAIVFIIFIVVFVVGGIVNQKKWRRQEQAKRQEQEKRAERKREREEKQKQYILDHHDDVLQKFAERRFQDREEPEDMAHLVYLLIKKNPSLLDDSGIDELIKGLVNQRIGFLKQEEFNRPILRLNPKDFEDCLEIFCHRYPKPSGKQFRRFRWLVTEDSRFAPPCDLSDLNDLKRLLEKKKEELEQKEFNEKILRLEPKDFKGCLDIFFHHYSNPSHNKLGQFFRLVTEDSRFSPPCDLLDLNDLKRLLEEKKQDIKAEEFEKKLFQDSSNQDSSLDQRLVSIEDVDGMEGHDFESFLEKLFTEMGYYAEKTRGSGDQGADLILKKDGLTTVVQAKRSQKKIPNKAVQEVLAGEKYYGADRLMVVTNHFFHESAKELAKRGSVELVDRNELRSWISSNPISDRG